MIRSRWGYLQTGSGVPKHIKPIVSRMIDLKYSTIMCREAYNLHGEADVSRINKWGGFDIEYPRLAIIDGDADPWVEATPHATGARPRRDSLDKPFILIPGAIHHCK